MTHYTSTTGNLVKLNKYEYEKALRENRIITTVGSPHRLLLPERKQTTAGSL